MSGASRWSRKWAAILALLVLAGAAAYVLAPATAKGTVFLGHYGYAFKLTPETTRLYHITAAFRDKARTHEVVFVYPKRMSPEQVFETPESSYGEAGVLRLEVNLNSAYPPEAQDKLLDAFRYAAQKTLKTRGREFQMAELQGATLPGFAIHIGGEKPVSQVFLKGEKVHYLLTSHRDNPALHEILSSLADAGRVAEALEKESKGTK